MQLFSMLNFGGIVHANFVLTLNETSTNLVLV